MIIMFFISMTPLTGVNYRNLESWQSYTKQDPNSGKISRNFTKSDQIRFEYNASKITG
jgi:tagatose-1,6-bisphosphate aldolase non-catalytic subunit AgaZ/GatZ